MYKCAIIIDSPKDNINLDNYSILIGVEGGSKCVFNSSFKGEKYYISDFDSVSNKELENLKSNVSKSNIKILDDETKLWSDGEEAILLANKLGFNKTNIEIFANENKRIDHFVNMMYVLRKYGCKFIGINTIVDVVDPDIKTEIKKHGDYITAMFFEKTKIKTSGLKWDVDKTFDLDSKTNFLSNKILKKSFKVRVDKKTLFIQVKENE